jgi:autotransporter-associated beta strand protein
VYSGTLILTNASALPTTTVLAVSNLTSFGNAAVTFDADVVFPVTSVMRISSQNGQNGIVSAGGNGTWNGPIFMHGANTFSIGGGTTLLDLAGPIITTNASGPVTFHGSNTRVRGALNIPTSPVTIGVGDGLGAGFNERFTTVTFDSSNRWTTTTIDRGRVNIGTNNAIPVTSAIRVGTLAAGVADRRIIFDLAGYSQVISNITETFVGDSLVLIGNSSETGDSLLTFTSGITNTWAIRILDTLDAPATPHKTALTVTSGTLNLVGTNTYTGPTLITGGRLNLNRGSGLTAGFVGQLGESRVTISGTGVLGGNGLANGTVTNAAGGTLSPGNAVGTLMVNNSVYLNAGSVTWMEVHNAGGSNDMLQATGDIVYGGTLVVTNVTPTAGYTNGQVITLFPGAASYAGSFSTIIVPGALAYDASQLTVNGTITITSAVSTAPAPITSTPIGGNQLQLSWPADHLGWRLQTQTNSLSTGITGTWYEVPGSSTVTSMTVPIVAGNPTVFYRLIYP